jgi:phytanoyl-CoA hydroxylase
MNMLTDKQLGQYQEEGYIIIENIFTAEDMNELMKHIDKLDYEQEQQLRKLGQQGISIPNQINFTPHLNQQDSYIEQFIAQDKFVEISTSLLGPDIKLYWDQSVYKRPEADRDFPWHQDTGYALTKPEVYITCWLALEDTTVENGCIWVKPGTHHLGLVEHQETPIGKKCYFGEDHGIPVPLRKGSMVVFNSLLFHRSTPNLSSTTRKGYIIQYSVEHAVSGVTGELFHNGPVIARDGNPAYENHN